MFNITLIGMPGSGKSTVGVLLAKSAGMGFIDTDLLIQSASGRLLYKMIEEEGIDAFLRTEERVIGGLVCDNCVIATGGSAVYGEGAMEKLSRMGLIVYLKLPCEEVEKRLRNIRTRGVAMRAGETLRQLYEERVPLYEKYAHVTVDAASDPEETVAAILKEVEKRG